MKHFIDFHTDVTIDELDALINTAIDLKAKTKASVPHPILSGKSLGMIFSKSSTRTRVSFEVGMYQLGGQALFLSSDDIQLGRGESIEDTAKVLTRMLDCIMIRTFSHQDIVDLARYGDIPIINGLSDDQHPTQALADLITIKEHKGSLKGLKLAYVGDGNNVANSLLQACAKAGMHISVATPSTHACPQFYVDQALADAKITGSEILITEDPVAAIQALHLQAVGGVLPDGAVRQEREVLEDHADLLAADPPQGCRVEAADVGAVDDDGPCGRVEQAVDGADQR